MKLTMKHTKLITLLLISFVIMILIAGLEPTAARFFGLTLAVMFVAVVIFSLPLIRFTDTKLSVQMLN